MRERAGRERRGGARGWEEQGDGRKTVGKERKGARKGVERQTHSALDELGRGRGRAEYRKREKPSKVRARASEKKGREKRERERREREQCCTRRTVSFHGEIEAKKKGKGKRGEKVSRVYAMRNRDDPGAL